MISVLISNWNRAKDGILPITAMSYIGQSVQEEVELIFADDISPTPDDLYQLNYLKDTYGLQNARVVQSEDSGPRCISRAVNTAARYANGDKVVITQTDFYMAPHALEWLTSNLSDDMMTMACSYWVMPPGIESCKASFSMLSHRNSTYGWQLIKSLPDFYEWKAEGMPWVTVSSNHYFETQAPLEKFHVSVAGMTRTVFERMGSFPQWDPQQGQGPIDGWWMQRVKDLGLRYKGLPEPCVCHIHHERD